MKASTLFILIGFVSITASCSHKGVQHFANTDNKVKAKVEAQDKSNKGEKRLVYTCLVGKDKRAVTVDKKEKRFEKLYTEFQHERQSSTGRKHTFYLC